MQSNIQEHKERLSALQARHGDLITQTASDLSKAEQTAQGAYTALLATIADGRDSTEQHGASAEAQTTLAAAKLSADVGKVQADRLQAEIDQAEQDYKDAIAAQHAHRIEVLTAEITRIEKAHADAFDSVFELMARGYAVTAEIRRERAAVAGDTTPIITTGIPNLWTPSVTGTGGIDLLPQQHTAMLVTIDAEVSTLGAKS